MPDRWTEIDELFREALERPPAERSAFVDASRTDPEIKREVKALLDAVDEADDYLSELAMRSGLGEEAERGSALRDVHAGLEPAGEGGEGAGAVGARLFERLREGLADRYEVEGELGEGGMAFVFLARDLRHDRRVAIKAMKPEVVGSAGADRFLREIRIAAHLQHPHILSLYDSGDLDGLLYYVMPYVEGESLRERLDRERQLSVEEATGIVSEVADGLAHAHEQGLIHRDIKPENILLSGGHAMLADFGIARAMDRAGGEKLTSTGLAIGTPSYMSPEQWEGKGTLDGRSDQYALACVLYEMLVGEPPFTGPTPQVVLARHALDDVPSIRIARPSVPDGIEEVVRTGMAKVPADRFPTVTAFAEALDEALEGRSVPGTPRRGTRARPRAGAARRRWPWIAAAGALAAAVATGVLVTRGSGPAGSVPRDSRVVVGLFENQTLQDSLQMLGAMAIDWITEGLLGAGGLDVVPPPTAIQASRYVEGQRSRDAGIDPVYALARETRAGTVVSGTYQLNRDTLIFSVNIADVARNDPGRTRLLANIRERGPVDSPVRTLEAVRRRVLGAFALSQDERLEAGRPPTYEAYSEFSLGLDDYIGRRFGEAIPRFYRAVELDSTYSVPLLYAALSHLNLGERRRADSLAKALDGVRTRLTPYHERWLGYLEGQLAGDRVAALEAIRRAAAGSPASKASYNRAYVALQVGRPAEALEALAELDPDRGPMRDWFPYWFLLTTARHWLAEHEAELRAADSARVRYPDRLFSQQLVATALVGLARLERVEALVDSVSLLPLESDPVRPVTPGSMYHELGAELRVHGHDRMADAFFSRAVGWYEDFGENHPDSVETEAYRTSLAALLHDAGRFEEALALVRAMEEESGGALRHRRWLGVLLAATGREAEARAIDREMARIDVPYDYGRTALARARIAAHLGESDRAIGLLREAYRDGLPATVHPDYNFHELWDDPRLVELHAPRG